VSGLLYHRWASTCSKKVRLGATHVGQPREAGATLNQAHILTPADVDETHYFWSSNSQYPQPAEEAKWLRQMLREAFDLEDKPMIETAFRNVTGDFWDQKPISLGIDTGGPRAHRIIQLMKKAEEALPTRCESRP
jgi:hypothetical protein